MARCASQPAMANPIRARIGVVVAFAEWMWSGWIARSRVSPRCPWHVRMIGERHSAATAFTRTGLRRLGVQTRW